MRDFRDAKAMAQTLREALNAKSVSLTHSESLELIAKILGCRDWNALAARIASSSGHDIGAGDGIAAARQRSHPANPRVRRLPWLPRSSTTTSGSISLTTAPFSR